MGAIAACKTGVCREPQAGIAFTTAREDEGGVRLRRAHPAARPLTPALFLGQTYASLRPSNPAHSGRSACDRGSKSSLAGSRLRPALVPAQPRLRARRAAVADARHRRDLRDFQRDLRRPHRTRIPTPARRNLGAGGARASTAAAVMPTPSTRCGRSARCRRSPSDGDVDRDRAADRRVLAGELRRRAAVRERLQLPRRAAGRSAARFSHPTSVPTARPSRSWS